MNIDIDSEWRDKINCQLTVKVKVVDSQFVYGKSSLGCVYQEPISVFLANFEPVQKNSTGMINHPLHYKDASGIECIEVTQHMGFCEGSSFHYVYQAGSNASLIEDLKTAAWYAERSWKRNRCRNTRVHWLVQRKGEAIADSRDEQGQTFIAEVMRNIVNNRYWQAYDSLMTEIERLESGEFK